jgi:hypothetical protein
MATFRSKKNIKALRRPKASYVILEFEKYRLCVRPMCFLRNTSQCDELNVIMYLIFKKNKKKHLAFKRTAQEMGGSV